MNMELFDKACEWYQKGGDFRTAACELFSKTKLEKGIDAYNEKKKKERLAKREEDLKKVLERCKKKFPIGTLVWSDEGSDRLPNLIISEPYIAETDYRAPYSAYECGEKNRKSVFVKTMRLSKCKPLHKDTVCLEICLEHMDSKSDYCRRDHIIHFKDFYETETEEKNSKLKWLKDNQKRVQNQLDDINKEINWWESYNPTDLNKESVKEILKECLG